MNRWNRRQGRKPLDHHHDPSLQIVYKGPKAAQSVFKRITITSEQADGLGIVDLPMTFFPLSCSHALAAVSSHNLTEVPKLSRQSSHSTIIHFKSRHSHVATSE